MPDPIATPQDVYTRINIPEAEGRADGNGVSEDDVITYLLDAVFALEQGNDLGTIADDVRRQLEWRLAAIDILTTRIGSRAYHQQSLGSMSRSYEVKMVEKLREDVGRISRENDLESPIDTVGGVERDTDRYVRSVSQERERETNGN